MTIVQMFPLYYHEDDVNQMKREIKHVMKKGKREWRGKNQKFKDAKKYFVCVFV